MTDAQMLEVARMVGLRSLPRLDSKEGLQSGDSTVQGKALIVALHAMEQDIMQRPAHTKEEVVP